MLEPTLTNLNVVLWKNSECNLDLDYTEQIGDLGDVSRIGGLFAGIERHFLEKET